jgi:hypothetical protein
MSDKRLSLVIRGSFEEKQEEQKKEGEGGGKRGEGKMGRGGRTAEGEEELGVRGASGTEGWGREEHSGTPSRLSRAGGRKMASTPIVVVDGALYLYVYTEV